MADLTITPGSVIPGANAKFRELTAGATIAQGDVVYEDSANSNVAKLADCNASAATANPVGIARQAVSTGQKFDVITEDDDLTIGATLSLSVASVIGIFVLSANPGKIAVAADLAAGHYPVILGTVKSTTKMAFKIIRGTAPLTA